MSSIRAAREGAMRTHPSGRCGRSLRLGLLLPAALAMVLSACRQSSEPEATEARPPRSFMKGGAWYPEATGYWFHQYAEADELTAWMREAGFACSPSSAAGSGPGQAQLTCERSFRAPGGLLSRSDSAWLGFRSNGAVEFAEADCRYTLFDSPSLSGRCKRFAASGAVYPGVESFAQVVYAMLLPARTSQRIDVSRLESMPVVPLRDADDAVERLIRWRFDCEAPKQHYRAGPEGKIGRVEELRCQQYSLRTLGRRPQSQQVIVHYDSVDLAVLGVEVQLDGAPAMLPQAVHTRPDDREGAESRRR